MNRYPDERWEPPEIAVHITGGPERIYDDKEAGEPPPFLGFRIDPEPLLWDGDQA